jgi:ribosome biogenesis protein YTM1
MTLDGHTGPVSSVIFDKSQRNTLYSGSWDHSIRLWDVEQQSNTMTINSEKVVVCMEVSAALNMVMSGHEDGWMRLWDPRAKG